MEVMVPFGRQKVLTWWQSLGSLLDHNALLWSHLCKLCQQRKQQTYWNQGQLLPWDRKISWESWDATLIHPEVFKLTTGTQPSFHHRCKVWICIFSLWLAIHLCFECWRQFTFGQWHHKQVAHEKYGGHFEHRKHSWLMDWVLHLAT